MRELAVFDTNIVIDWLNGHPMALKIYSEHQRIGISRVTYAEVLVGYKDPEIKAAVEELLTSCFLVDDTTQEIADEAVRARQETRVGLCDAFIYATAYVRGCPVYSRNPKDFKKLERQNPAGVIIPYCTLDLGTSRLFDQMEVRIDGRVM